MLDLSDSRNFSRTLAALGLLLGPLLFLLGTLLDPAWNDDPGAYLDEVAAGVNRYRVAGALWSLGSLLFIPGVLGIVKLMRGKGVTLGQWGAALLCVGLILFSSSFAFYGTDVILAHYSDRDAAVGIAQALEDSSTVGAFYLVTFVGGIVLGSILLAVALMRRKIVPVWSPALLVLSTVVGFFAENQMLSAVSLVLLVAGFYPLSAKIRSLSDEAWGRWQPLGEEPGATTVASSPTDPQPA